MGSQPVYSSLLLFFALALVGCTGGPRPSALGLADTFGDLSTTVRWDANHETAVNSPGGGYRIFFSKDSNADLANCRTVDVPYVSGPLAPTTGVMDHISPGTYYVRVVAYSAMSPPGGTGGSASTPSAMAVITVE